MTKLIVNMTEEKENLMGMSASVSTGHCVLVINWRISTPTLDGGKHSASHGEHQSKRTAQ